MPAVVFATTNRYTLKADIARNPGVAT